MYDSDDDSDAEGFECCSGGACARRRGGGCGGSTCGSNGGEMGLPFDPAAIQSIILNLSDQFDFRVALNDKRLLTAALVTGGMALAGSVLGKHCAGNVGAMIGGAVGGACGLGIVVVSLREIWDAVQNRLWELYEIAYDYMAGMGLQDYQQAASFLIGKTTSGEGAQLAQILAEVASGLLKTKITTSIMPNN